MQRHGVPTRALTLPAAAPARTAAPRAASLTLAFALILGGCGGGTTSSGGASPSAAPSTQSAASAGPAKHRHRRHRRGHHAAGAVAVAPAAPAAPAASTNGSWPCNDAQFTQDQQQFANGTLRGDQEVDVCGTVTQVLAAKTTSSGLHGYFYVRVAPGDTIEIVSDLGDDGRARLALGESRRLRLRARPLLLRQRLLARDRLDAPRHLELLADRRLRRHRRNRIPIGDASNRSEMHGHEFQAFFLFLRGRFHSEVILAARARCSAG